MGLKISNNTWIVELSKQSLNEPVFIQGLPGLGFVGKISVDFLIEQLKPIKLAELYSTHLALPDGGLGVKIELNGTYKLPKYSFYAYKGKPDILFLAGDIQPSMQGQYDVIKHVLKYVKGFGCKSIIALGGYGIRSKNIDDVYVVASDPKIIQMLGKKKVKIAQGGSVKGAFGVILQILAQTKKIPLENIRETIIRIDFRKIFDQPPSGISSILDFPLGRFSLLGGVTPFRAYSEPGVFFRSARAEFSLLWIVFL